MYMVYEVLLFVKSSSKVDLNASMFHVVFGPFDNKEDDYSVHESLFHVF